MGILRDLRVLGGVEEIREQYCIIITRALICYIFGTITFHWRDRDGPVSVWTFCVDTLGSNDRKYVMHLRVRVGHLGFIKTNASIVLRPQCVRLQSVWKSQKILPKRGLKISTVILFHVQIALNNNDVRKSKNTKTKTNILLPCQTQAPQDIRPEQNDRAKNGALE